MDNVILLSIERGKSENEVVAVVEADGRSHRCVFNQIPGRTAFGFDDEFNRVFAMTDFGRPLGSIVSRFMYHGETPKLPFRVLPHRQTVKHAS
jgi:hypothetical protein